MAEDPIWLFSNGSSISLRLASRRQSVAILWALAPIRTKSGKDVAVDLARIGLAGDGVALGKTKGVAHYLVKLFDFVVVAVEEGEEAALGAGGALDARKRRSLRRRCRLRKSITKS